MLKLLETISSFPEVTLHFQIYYSKFINTFFFFPSFFFFTRLRNTTAIFTIVGLSKAFQFFDGFIRSYLFVIPPRIILYSQFSFSNRIDDLAGLDEKNFLSRLTFPLSLSLPRFYFIREQPKR